MPEEYYLNKLYPFQDEILRQIQSLNVDFYLSGGTALSRCFLEHRYSDDLDLFLNNHPNFKHQCEIVVTHLKERSFQCTVSITTESFLRIFLNKKQLVLKIDFINDVPFHFGNLEKWVTQPDLKQAQVSLVLISEDILKGDQNSLVPEGK